MFQDKKLSDLQLAIMRALWDRGEARVAEVHADLEAERGLAPTTVATVLQRLERRGLLAHRLEGRQFVYRSLVTEPEVRGSMVSELTDLLFGGNPAELLSHLLRAGDFTPEDLKRVKRLLEARAQKQHKQGDGA